MRSPYQRTSTPEGTPTKVGDILDRAGGGVFPMHLALRRLITRLWFLTYTRPGSLEPDLNDAQLAARMIAGVDPDAHRNPDDPHAKPPQRRFAGDTFENKVPGWGRKCVPVRDMAGRIVRNPDGSQKEHWIDVKTVEDEALSFYGGLLRRIARSTKLPPRSMLDYSEGELALITKHVVEAIEQFTDVPTETSAKRAADHPFFPDGWESAYTWGKRIADNIDAMTGAKTDDT